MYKIFFSNTFSNHFPAIYFDFIIANLSLINLYVKPKIHNTVYLSQMNNAFSNDSLINLNFL